MEYLSVNHTSSSGVSGSSLSNVISRSPSQTAAESSTTLRCTFLSCEAKEEDKVFTGKGATSAHKSVTVNPIYFRIVIAILTTGRRHMDSHTRPYMCPEVQCPRHTDGFSRLDNLKNHQKRHRKKVGRHTARVAAVSNPLGVLGGSINATHRKNLKVLSGHERRKLMNTLFLLIDLGFDDEEEDESAPEDGYDNEEMEED